MCRGTGHVGFSEPRLIAAEYQRVAADPLMTRMFIEMLNHGRESARQVKVVAIQVSNDVSGRVGQAFVDRVGLPPIFFAHPMRKLTLILANHIDAAISTAAVHDNKLKVFIVLVQHGPNRLFDVLDLIVRGRDY
jgi:hypothetical protein